MSLTRNKLTCYGPNLSSRSFTSDQTSRVSIEQTDYSNGRWQSTRYSDVDALTVRWTALGGGGDDVAGTLKVGVTLVISLIVLLA